MIVDTDVIIRFLTNDDEGKAKRFERFLASGEKVRLTDVTVAEVYWTLKSFYRFEKKKILKALEGLIQAAAIICDQEVWEETIKVLKNSNIILIDAYVVAMARVKNDGRVLSFDKGLGKLKGIKRVEP